MTPNEMTPSQEELNINEPINQEAQQEETTQACETTNAVEPEGEPEAENKVLVAPETKQAVIERLQELSHADNTPEREEIDFLKKIYYRLRHEEVAAQHEKFINAGGTEEEFEPFPDADEEKFKAELSLVKEKRAKQHEIQEKLKQDNLKRKQEILEQIKAFSGSPEDANKNYDAFRKLQAEWKETNPVPAENSTELWKNYQYLVENFYDMLKLNNEFREYDFKKNLEAKTRLCEAAEKLEDFADPVSAFHQLQKLHQEFREIGPVSKDLREEIWNRFKAASVIVNKRHQAYFENQKAKENENLEKKTALCEKVEAMDLSNLKTFNDWDKTTQEIIALQAEWKTIGFTPRNVNTKIFERFRQACDNFFKQKSDYFKQLKASLNENYAKKIALCEKAEALKDSTEWNSTFSKLNNLMEEWKSIGSVPNKVSDSIWKRFNEARNAFFDARRKATSSQRESEKQNLEAKLNIIEQLKAITAEAKEEGVKKVQELMNEWQTIGYVPFKMKEKIYKEYHEQTDRLYKELNMGRTARRVENIKARATAAISRGGDAMYRERERLFQLFEAKRNEIKTYENNLGFLNVSSKNGSGFVNDIKNRIANLKEELDGIRKSIEDIDSKANAANEEGNTDSNSQENKD